MGCTLIHFTPSICRWGISPTESMLSMEESINSMRTGLKSYTHFGLVEQGNYVMLYKNFVHHGLRCNRKKNFGQFGLPACFVINRPDHSHVHAGPDAPGHIYLSTAVAAEEIVDIFTLDFLKPQFDKAETMDFAQYLRACITDDMAKEFAKLISTRTHDWTMPTIV